MIIPYYRNVMALTPIGFRSGRPVVNWAKCWAGHISQRWKCSVNEAKASRKYDCVLGVYLFMIWWWWFGWLLGNSFLCVRCYLVGEQMVFNPTSEHKHWALVFICHVICIKYLIYIVYICKSVSIIIKYIHTSAGAMLLLFGVARKNRCCCYCRDDA